MKTKIALCVAIFAIIFAQACSDSAKEISEFHENMDEGYFIGDSTKVKTDGKFLCDFQWTTGLKRWDYRSALIDIPMDDNEEVNEPWCLIPYGESTEFFITAQSDIEDKKGDYICRDLNVQYSLDNEEMVDIVVSKDTKTIIYIYKNHQQMMCVPISKVVVTAQNPVEEYMYKKKYIDERLYHVTLNTDGMYSIEGHVNLRLVKPINLTVVWEPILYGSSSFANPDRIKNDWKTYMKKVGYYIDIITVPIFFPNNMESVKENFYALTLPAEKGAFELNGNFANWYNGSLFNRNADLERWGAEFDLHRIQQANYVMVTTEKYNLQYNNPVTWAGIDGVYNPDGYNYCSTIYTAQRLLSMTTGLPINSDFTSIKNSLIGYYNNKDGKRSSASSPNTGILDFSENINLNTKSECESISEIVYENIGTNIFNIPKGYVLNHQYFYSTDNTGRLLASLLYSKILGIDNPINGNNSLWLSSYSDNSEVGQPKMYWRDYPPTRNLRQELHEQLKEFIPILEFASNR